MPDNLPGQTLIEETHEAQIWAAGPDNNHKRYQQKIHIKSTVVDSGNTGYTTTIRAGNAIGRKDSDGLDYLYDADANDGTQACLGLLEHTISMLRSGTAADRFTHMLTSGIIRNIDDLIGVDKAAMANLLRLGWTVAQPTPHGSAFLMHPWRRDIKTGDYTVLDADHGKLLIAEGAGAINFTMPSLATVGPGFEVLLFNGAAQNMVVTGAANTIVYGDAGGALSTTLTFSTANKMMGGQVLMRADYNAAGTLLWYPLGLPTTVTSA